MPNDRESGAVAPLGHYLKATLARFDPWLKPLPEDRRAPVTEIAVNRPGEVWVERQGGAMERVADAVARTFTETYLATLARQIAAHTGQAVSSAAPLLAATLPGGERIQIVRPPASPDGHALAIRRAVLCRPDLASYARTGAFADTCADGSDVERERAHLRELQDRQDWTGFLRAAVHARLNIVISGGTSSGKTTFLNALLAEIDPTDRVVSLEDTREIAVAHPNRVHLVAARNGALAMTDLLEASLRLRPDRLILGELRGAEAFAYLRAVNTGHPGSLTTVHASSPDGAVDQIALMALQAGQGLSRDDILGLVERMVDVIVQVGRAGPRRGVSTVWYRHATHEARAA